MHRIGRVKLLMEPWKPIVDCFVDCFANVFKDETGRIGGHRVKRYKKESVQLSFFLLLKCTLFSEKRKKKDLRNLASLKKSCLQTR